MSMRPKDCAAKLAENNPSLTRVVLVDNALFQMKSAEYAELIADGLKNNKHCVELTIDKCGLLDQGAVKIAEALHHNKTLEKLNLPNNKLGPVALAAIAEMLKVNRSISELNLSGNSGSAGGKWGDAPLTALADALEGGNTTLVKIVWRLDNRISWKITKLMSRNVELGRRQAAGTHLDAPEGKSSPVTSPKRAEEKKEEKELSSLEKKKQEIAKRKQEEDAEKKRDEEKRREERRKQEQEEEERREEERKQREERRKKREEERKQEEEKEKKREEERKRREEERKKEEEERRKAEEAKSQAKEVKKEEKKEEGGDPVEKAKQKAAQQAVNDTIKSGMKIGVGSGSTIVYAVLHLADKYKNGELKDIICVPTSFQSKQLLIQNGLPIGELEQFPELDVGLDGADECDRKLNLIKGGGACLAMEKLVAAACGEFYVIADFRKRGDRLGTQWKKGVPVEVLPVGWKSVSNAVAKKWGGVATLRMGQRKAGPVVTDNGNFILDIDFGEMNDRKVKELDVGLNCTVGVVDHGLFVGMAKRAYFGGEDGGVDVLDA